MFQSDFFIRKIIIVFVAIFIFNACAPTVAQEIPRIVDNRIYFLDDKTRIEIEAGDIFHIFTEQNRIVHISEQPLSHHHSEYQMFVFDFMGEEIARPLIHGLFSFIFAETAERILAASAVLQNHTRSFLYDLDGNLLNVLYHDRESKQAGITEDERYFWFVANRMRPLYPGEDPFLPDLLPGFMHTPYNHIMVFDAHTGEFIESFSTRESTFTFTVNGIEYSINMSPPDIPG